AVGALAGASACARDIEGGYRARGSAHEAVSHIAGVDADARGSPRFIDAKGGGTLFGAGARAGSIEVGAEAGGAGDRGAGDEAAGGMGDPAQRPGQRDGMPALRTQPADHGGDQRVRDHGAAGAGAGGRADVQAIDGDAAWRAAGEDEAGGGDRSEEHTSELQSLTKL